MELETPFISSKHKPFIHPYNPFICSLIHDSYVLALHQSFIHIHLFLHLSIHSFIHSHTLYSSIPPVIHSYTLYPSNPPVIHSFIHSDTLYSFVPPSHSFLHIYSSVPPVIHSYTLYSSVPPVIHSYKPFIHPSFHSFIHPSLHSSITYLAQDCVAGDDDHNGEHSQAREHNKVGTENHRQELPSCTPE